MSKINNCQYCKSAVDVYGILIETEGEDIEGYAAYCEICGVCGPVHVIKTKAISLWNMMQVKECSE